MIRFPLICSTLIFAMINIALVGYTSASLMQMDVDPNPVVSINSVDATPSERPADQEQVLIDWNLCPITGGLEASASSVGSTCFCSASVRFENDDRSSTLFATDFRFVPSTFLRGLNRPPRT